MKTAIVHDWFAGYAGSEKVVESLTNIWKDADVFCLFDFLSSADRKQILKEKKPVTSFIQNLPFARRNHRNYLPLFPYAIEQFDLSGYDLVISSSHAVAKGALTNSSQLHICYCHTPIRYAWDLMSQYLDKTGLNKGLKSFAVRAVLHYIRMWDINSAPRPDFYIANSNYIAARIKKIYGRDAAVIYPPVDIYPSEGIVAKENYYITASRLVPYKRVDLIISAFSSMPGRRLIVAGDGPEFNNLKSKGAPNITFTGYLSAQELHSYLSKAKAFVFAADEDFGIAPVEALGCGTPVIALNKGGTAETIIDGNYGILFDRQDDKSISDAVIRFENSFSSFKPDLLRTYAQQFGRNIFEQKIKAFVDSKIDIFQKQK